MKPPLPQMVPYASRGLCKLPTASLPTPTPRDPVCRIQSTASALLRPGLCDPREAQLLPTRIQHKYAARQLQVRVGQHGGEMGLGPSKGQHSWTWGHSVPSCGGLQAAG